LVIFISASGITAPDGSEIVPIKAPVDAVCPTAFGAQGSVAAIEKKAQPIRLKADSVCELAGRRNIAKSNREREDPFKVTMWVRFYLY
jgi:hypothetical protein